MLLLIDKAQSYFHFSSLFKKTTTKQNTDFFMSFLTTINILPTSVMLLILQDLHFKVPFGSPSLFSKMLNYMLNFKHILKCFSDLGLIIGMFKYLGCD